MKFFPSLIPRLALTDIWPFLPTSTVEPRCSLNNPFQDGPLYSHDKLTEVDKKGLYFTPQPCALRHGHLTESHTVPPGDETALASKEFLERHQVTAPKIKTGACWLQLSLAEQLPSRGREVGMAVILSLVSMSGREVSCLCLQHRLLWKLKPRKRLLK